MSNLYSLQCYCIFDIVGKCLLVFCFSLFQAGAKMMYSFKCLAWVYPQCLQPPNKLARLTISPSNFVHFVLRSFDLFKTVNSDSTDYIIHHWVCLISVQL